MFLQHMFKWGFQWLWCPICTYYSIGMDFVGPSHPCSDWTPKMRLGRIRMARRKSSQTRWCFYHIRSLGAYFQLEKRIWLRVLKRLDLNRLHWNSLRCNKLLQEHLSLLQTLKWFPRRSPTIGKTWPTPTGSRITPYLQSLVYSKEYGLPWGVGSTLNPWVNFHRFDLQAEGTDLDRIIPVRFYGDGCEAMSFLAILGHPSITVAIVFYEKIHLRPFTEGNRNLSWWVWSAQRHPKLLPWTPDSWNSAAATLPTDDVMRFTSR